MVRTLIPIGRIARRSFGRTRRIYWAVLIIVGFCTGFGITCFLDWRHSIQRETDQARLVAIGQEFKDTYVRWLSAGGSHDLPTSEIGWIRLQNNLFIKWTSQEGDRIPIGEGIGAVYAEVPSKDGDPSLVRLKRTIRGRITGSYVVIEPGIVLRLREWNDGSVGWHATRD